ncbi:putative rIIA protector from prophage-induced early lysis [Alishewanella phage vB_AspM_Slickus01]|nr:putative rIIA protector from prophage-induced early lysis [Alishewanella phage vB_AspM_Slickus01]
MQLRTTHQPVHTSGNSVRSSNFKFEMNDKMFEIFSSSIYSNKIRAVVREVCTNAYDAHLASDIGEVPFDIHLPSPQSPMMSIRDYGTGLSEEQVFEIYTVYFRSTKDGDDQAHGGYGLGSKSPLAYVDSFQIRSYQNGKMQSFTCYKKSGVPAIDLIVTVATTEPDGLEVSFAVNDEDRYRFYREIGHVISTFPVKPNLIGESVINRIETYTIEASTKNIFTVVGNTGADLKKYNILIEPVLYPINDDMLEVFKKSKTYKLIYRNRHDALAFKFDIGALDIPPSREQVDNTQHNIDTFSNFMGDIDTIYTETIDKIFKSTEDLPFVEAYNKVRELISEMVDGNEKMADAIYEYFADNEEYQYHTIIPEYKVTDITKEITEDGDEVKVATVRTVSPEKRMLSTSYSYTRRFISDSFEVLNSFPTSFYNFSLRSTSARSIFNMEHLLRQKTLTVVEVPRKLYKRVFEKHEDAMLEAFDQKNTVFMFSSTVSSPKDRLNKLSMTGDFGDIFENYKLITESEFVKMFPLEKTERTLTARGTKPHPIIRWTKFGSVEVELSINDLYEKIDNGGVRYIDVFASSKNNKKDFFDFVKKCDFVDLASLFNGDGDEIFLLINDKFNTAITRSQKMGDCVEDVYPELYNLFKEKFTHIMHNLSEYMGHDELHRTSNTLFRKIANTDVIRILQKQFDPVMNDREFKKVTHYQLYSIISKIDDFGIFGYSEARDILSQFLDTGSIFERKIAEHKNILGMLTFIDSYVYNDTPEHEVLLDYVESQLSKIKEENFYAK